MSGVGFWELIILLLIGLIVLGPERLPRVANQLGNWIGQARRMTRVMKRQLEDELNLEREPTIRPARLSAPPPTQTQPQPQAREDHGDTYSPAHASDDIGTGVGTDVEGEPAPAGGPPPDDKDDAGAPAAGDDDAGTNKPQ